MKTLTATWVSDLLQTTFRASFEEKRNVAGGKTWRASLLGSCPRRQYLDLVLHREPVVPMSDTTRRNFAVGHMVGWYMSGLFHDAGILISEEHSLSDDDLDIGAHVDFIIGGRIPDPDHSSNEAARLALREMFGDDELPVTGIELKTKKPESVYWAEKKNEPMADVGQRMQAGIYDVLAERAGLKIDSWQVLTFNKAFFDEADWSKKFPEWFQGGLLLTETPVEEADRERALDRLAILNEAKRANDPHALPCRCMTDWGGKARFYCPYFSEFDDVCCEVRA